MIGIFFLEALCVSPCPGARQARAARDWGMVGKVPKRRLVGPACVGNAYGPINPPDKKTTRYTIAISGE